MIYFRTAKVVPVEGHRSEIFLAAFAMYFICLLLSSLLSLFAVVIVVVVVIVCSFDIYRSICFKYRQLN